MTDRRALIVGINQYEKLRPLRGATNDAKEIERLLSRNEDGGPNYECRLLLDVIEDGKPITRVSLRRACQELFANFRGDVLLYFAGHGVLTPTGGYLCTVDAEMDDWGISMQEILDLANNSVASDILLLLDCCYSGDMGNVSLLNSRSHKDALALATVRENTTILAASHAQQTSEEDTGHGLFTAAVLDALDGGAADHMGSVTAPSIYAYVEPRFGSWDQRPVYKSHATTVTPVRRCAPLIGPEELRKLVNYFNSPDYKYPLDPEHEPEDEHGNRHEPVNEEKVAIAQLFKEYRDAGLLKPSTEGEQLYWTARRSHTVELTRRGKQFWRLASSGKI